MIILDHGNPNASILLPALPQTEVNWSLSQIAPGNSTVSATCHDHYEIYIHVYGDVSLLSDGRLYLLSPGDVTILPPYTIHRLINPRMKAARYCSLRIPEIFCQDYFVSLYRQSNCRYLSPNITEARQLTALCSSLDILTQQNEPCAAKRLSAVFALIAHIESMQVSGHFLSPTPLSLEVTNVIEFLESSYAQSLTLSDIARHAGVSPQVLAKLFRSELDTTPIQYLLDLRLRMARNMLNTTLPLSEICKSCGFTDYSRFIERFRKAYGITPHKLRQLYFANAR